MIKVAPPEVLDQYRRVGIAVEANKAMAKAKVDEARTKLLDYIAAADSKQKEFLARTLGSGMILVRGDDGRVVAIERPVKRELQEFKIRVESFQRQVIQGQIGKIVEVIRGKNRELNEQATNAERAKDQDALRRIANNDVPRIISEIQAELPKLKDEIEKARGDLDDKQTGVDAANFENSAAKFREQAGRAKVEAGALEVQKALLVRDLSKMGTEREMVALEEKRTRRDASKRRAELAQFVTRDAYYDCIERGIDPLTVDIKNGIHPGYFEEKDRVSGRCPVSRPERQ